MSARTVARTEREKTKPELSQTLSGGGKVRNTLGITNVFASPLRRIFRLPGLVEKTCPSIESWKFSSFTH